MKCFVDVVAALFLVSCSPVLEQVEPQPVPDPGTDDPGENTEIVHVKSVKVEPSTVTVETGASVSLKAVVMPADATDKGLTWMVTPSGVVLLSTTGAGCSVKGVKVGKADVVCKSKDGGFESKCSVEVVKGVVKVTGVKVYPETLTLGLDGTASLKATVTPDDAENKSVKWTSSAPAVVSVDASGNVRALSGGVSDVTVETVDGGFKTACRVTVNVVNAAQIVLSNTVVHLEPGKTRDLVAEVWPQNSSYKDVQWSTSNAAVASVSAKGVVTANALGVVVVTASAQNGRVVSGCAVSVDKKDQTPVPALSFDGVNPIPDGPLTLKINERKPLFMLGFPKDVYPLGGVRFVPTYGNADAFHDTGLRMWGNRPYVILEAGAKAGLYQAYLCYGKFTWNYTVKIVAEEASAEEKYVGIVGFEPVNAFVSCKSGETVELKFESFPYTADDDYYQLKVLDPSVLYALGGNKVQGLKVGKSLVSVNARDGKAKGWFVVEVY